MQRTPTRPIDVTESHPAAENNTASSTLTATATVVLTAAERKKDKQRRKQQRRRANRAETRAANNGDDNNQAAAAVPEEAEAEDDHVAFQENRDDDFRADRADNNGADKDNNIHVRDASDDDVSMSIENVRDGSDALARHLGAEPSSSESDERHSARGGRSRDSVCCRDSTHRSIIVITSWH